MSNRNFENYFMYNGASEISVPAENVVRVFSEKLSKSQIFHNLYIYSQLEESGLNIPKIKKVFPADDEHWGILEDNIKGKTLLFEMNDTSESYDEYLEILIELQTSVYEIAISDILPHKRILETQIKSLSVITDSKKAELLKTLKELPEGNKTIHGNFGPEYVITGEDDVLYMTDWASVASGSIAADAAVCYLNLSCISTQIAENYIKLFIDKTGCEEEEIRTWVPVMAASRLALGTTTALQRAFMCAWVDVEEEAL